METINVTCDQIRAAALGLTETQREELACHLLASLDPPGNEIRKGELEEELRSRLIALESGSLETVDLEEGMEELERRQRKRKQA